MRPSPWHDLFLFVTKPEWPTAVFWLLLIGSIAIAMTAWRRLPEQQTLRASGIWVLRLLTGAMWWQQSLWKIPPNEAGLVYWMNQMVAHASTTLQSTLVAGIVLPHIAVFGPLVYLIEVTIAISLLLGWFSRFGALLGLLMALNLWLGLYSAPGEWPWTYFFLVIIHVLFLIDPPGRCLGADALTGTQPRRRGRRAATGLA